MAKKLGPTFGDELWAAGVGGLPFSWSPDGDYFGRENLTPEQNATIDSVEAAHDPNKFHKQQKDKKAQRDAHTADANAQTLLSNMQTMTPAQIDAWISGMNDPNLRIVVASIIKLLTADMQRAPDIVVPPPIV